MVQFIGEQAMYQSQSPYPFRYGDTIRLIAKDTSIGEFTNAAADEDIDVQALTWADQDTYVDNLYIVPSLTASTNGSQYLDILATTTDLALADETAYVAYVLGTAAPVTVKTACGVGLAQDNGTLVRGANEEPPCIVNLPVRARYLSLRRNPMSEDVSRVITCDIYTLLPGNTKLTVGSTNR